MACSCSPSAAAAARCSPMRRRPTVTLSSANTGNGGDITFEQNGTHRDARRPCLQPVRAERGRRRRLRRWRAFAAQRGWRRHGRRHRSRAQRRHRGDGRFLHGACSRRARAPNGLGGNITATLSAGKQLVGGDERRGGVFRRRRGQSLHQPRHRAHAVGSAGFRVPRRRGRRLRRQPRRGHGQRGSRRAAPTASPTMPTPRSTRAPRSTWATSTNVLAQRRRDRAGRETPRGATRISPAASCSRRRGTSNMEIDFAPRDDDRITATGTANVAGNVNVSLLNTQNIRPGVSFQPLYTAAGGAPIAASRSTRRNRSSSTTNCYATGRERSRRALRRRLRGQGLVGQSRARWANT